MHSIWTGMITFGLVNIPVKLYVASEEQGLDFDMLTRDGHCRVKYARICRETGEEVEYKDIVKGYEYRKGDYVVLEPEDFENANVKKTQTIEVVSFCSEDEIDLKLLEKPYYLEPDKKVKKAYALIRDALAKSKKVGIAKFVIRSRGHLGVLKAEGDGLVLIQMRYSSEIRDSSKLDLPRKEKVSKQEQDLASQLIDQLTKPFHPEKFKDTYTENLKALIEQKAKGTKRPRFKKEKITPTKVPDLVSKLRKSLYVHRN